MNVKHAIAKWLMEQGIDVILLVGALALLFLIYDFWRGEPLREISPPWRKAEVARRVSMIVAVLIAVIHSIMLIVR
jgi:hypothetical protein